MRYSRREKESIFLEAGRAMHFSTLLAVDSRATIKSAALDVASNVYPFTAFYASAVMTGRSRHARRFFPRSTAFRVSLICRSDIPKFCTTLKKKKRNAACFYQPNKSLSSKYIYPRFNTRGYSTRRFAKYSYLSSHLIVYIIYVVHNARTAKSSKGGRKGERE